MKAEFGIGVGDLLHAEDSRSALSSESGDLGPTQSAISPGETTLADGTRSSTFRRTDGQRPVRAGSRALSAVWHKLSTGLMPLTWLFESAWHKLAQVMVRRPG